MKNKKRDFLSITLEGRVLLQWPYPCTVVLSDTNGFMVTMRLQMSWDGIRNHITLMGIELSNF